MSAELSAGAALRSGIGLLMRMVGPMDRARPPLLDAADLTDHQRRDLGLIDGRTPRRGDGQRR